MIVESLTNSVEKSARLETWTWYVDAPVGGGFHCRITDEREWLEEPFNGEERIGGAAFSRLTVNVTVPDVPPPGGPLVTLT